ncbi:MAG TPA: hypothetical protein HPQ04_12685 [Rhodospirillaceae bacterium]|nr:hypothetical protein [Rhodospirillaceae bacterium]
MKWLFATLVLALLAACGSSQAPEPVGVGTGRDELKRSPCGCFEIKQSPSLGA